MENGLDKRLQAMVEELSRTHKDLVLALDRQQDFDKEELIEFLYHIHKRNEEAKKLTERLGKINDMFEHRHISTLN